MLWLRTFWKQSFVSGPASEHYKKFVVWRLSDDKELVCLDGKLTPLCSVLEQMSSKHGLVDVQLLDHMLTQKMRPVSCLRFACAKYGAVHFLRLPAPRSPLFPRQLMERTMPAPFRYNVQPAPGEKTNCLKPNNFDVQDPLNVKHQILGQAYHGNFDKLCNNKRAGVVWEAPQPILKLVLDSFFLFEPNSVEPFNIFQQRSQNPLGALVKILGEHGHWCASQSDAGKAKTLATLQLGDGWKNLVPAHLLRIDGSHFASWARERLSVESLEQVLDS